MYRLLVTILIASLASCCPEDPFISSHTTVNKDVAYIRFVHASTTVGNIRFVAGNDYFQADQKFLSFKENNNEAQYYPVDTNIHEIKVVNSSGTVAKRDLKLNQNMYYTIYFYGQDKTLLTEDNPILLPTPNQTVIRFVNLSEDLPPLEVRLDSDSGEVLLNNLPRGSASDYITTKSYPLSSQGTGLYLFNALNKEHLFAIFKPYLYLPGSTVITAVITGNRNAYLGDSLLSFTLFQDNTSKNNLYGSLPYPIRFYGIKFVSLINDITKNDMRVALSFYESTDSRYAQNDYFRRYLPGFLLGNNPPHAHWVNDSSQWNRYFFHYPDFKNINRFRVEETVLDIYDFFGKQPVLVPEQTADLSVNNKYSFIVYGQYTKDTSKHQVKLAVVPDHIPRPEPNSIRLRFMHTSYGDNMNKKFALRVNSQVTPFVKYGETHASGFISTNQTQPTLEVIDESGKTVLSQNNLQLQLDEGYTIIFTKSYNTTTDELIKLTHHSKQ